MTHQHNTTKRRHNRSTIRTQNYASRWNLMELSPASPPEHSLQERLTTPSSILKCRVICRGTQTLKPSLRQRTMQRITVYRTASFRKFRGFPQGNDRTGRFKQPELDNAGQRVEHIHQSNWKSLRGMTFWRTTMSSLLRG